MSPTASSGTRPKRPGTAACTRPGRSPSPTWGTAHPADDEPEFASQSFPYDRIHIPGSGWEPKNDQYGVFLGSTVRGYGDSFMKENKTCNHFNLSAFDQDFFNNGVDYAYK